MNKLVVQFTSRESSTYLYIAQQFHSALLYQASLSAYILYAILASLTQLTAPMIQLNLVPWSSLVSLGTLPQLESKTLKSQHPKLLVPLGMLWHLHPHHLCLFDTLKVF